MEYFFTADQHFGHTNIIKYCNRPFQSAEEMNEVIIKKHNEIVTKNDTVIHAGDFSWGNPINYFIQLKGKNIVLKGSHGKYGNWHFLWEKDIQDIYIVVCHYAMLTWPRSHYGSWQLFGHSHGKLKNYNREKQYDVGVDNNNFYPVPFEKLKTILK
jgi:calcineurin-like phosphoesterase family protein